MSTLRDFMHENRLEYKGGTNADHELQQKDWDDFIQEFDGISCDKMCEGESPKLSTLQLFGNRRASDIFCQWCNS